MGTDPIDGNREGDGRPCDRFLQADEAMTMLVKNSARRRKSAKADSHGLSYTTFNFSKLEVSSIGLSVEVINSGVLPGERSETSSIGRAKQEFKSFSKKFLAQER